MEQLLFSTKSLTKGIKWKKQVWMIIKTILIIISSFIICFLIEDTYIRQIKNMNLDYYSEVYRIKKIKSTVSLLLGGFILADVIYLVGNAIATAIELSGSLEFYQNKIVGIGIHTGLRPKEFCLYYNQISHIEIIKGKHIKIYTNFSVYTVTTTKQAAKAAIEAYYRICQNNNEYSVI